ncbi:MBL fold metallo-hydrolase [bacterium]|nr:MBL fold metallo-hydrolase [bacterium]
MDAVIPFKREFSFEYGQISQVSPMIRRVVANNPNFFTFYGTNTYILGRGNVALVDPGPDLAEHIDAIRAGLQGEVITHIFITHTHFDHWPACRALQEAYGARSYAYVHEQESTGSPEVPSEDVKALSNQERFEISGFVPDVSVSHGDILQGDGWSVECVFTPGHASNHMCYQLREEKALMSGDHVMGWSTSVISPPSGNMEAYMNSLELLKQRDDACFWPAHGPGIDNPREFVQAFIVHRQERERDIITELKKEGVNTIREMVPTLYREVPEFLHPAAERSVLATIIYMIKKGTVVCNGEASVTARLKLV